MSGSLTHSVADVIRHLLIDLGHGTLPTTKSSWPVYSDNEPNTPDNAITVYNLTGTSSGRTMIDGELQEHHGIQVRIRSATPTTGFTKSRQIAVGLDTSSNLVSVSIGSSAYRIQTVSRKGDVISLGKDTTNSKRNLFTINAVVALRQTT